MQKKVSGVKRWREVKKGIHSQTEGETEPGGGNDRRYCAHLPNRIKAFIVDIFLIMMPIMYVTAYLIMEGKDDFQGSETARWVTSLLYGLIIVLFWSKSGQTPGFKAYELKVVDEETGENVSLAKAVWRYLLFIVSAISIVGLLLPFFRKDRKTFHDLFSKSCAIELTA